MTIDIARDSFNPRRDWRAVLAQQGRVTLEADINEQAAIESEEIRLETLDIVGPVGTPDGGYQVSVSGGDVQISKGTIYVGGLRLTLPAAITAAKQPGWLDMPPWPTPNGNEIVALLVEEQSVCAVEDQALLEVALGGPDSAGRLALLQHVLLIPSSATSCATAAAALPKLLTADGLSYDPADCALTSTMRLEVTPIEAGKNAGPCDPPASGGYLGADNQMIRVAVTEVAGNGGTLIWGWNNASFLYRATVSQKNVLTLLSDPLDPDHTPQAGQAVEILRATVNLGDGTQGVDGGGNFIAAGDGAVFVLGNNCFAAGTRALTLPHDLDPDYLNDGKRPLFVRLWTKQMVFTAGTPAILGDTGLSVTIESPSVPAIGGRPYWHFAVRPLTPQLVYPERYLHAPQPPDGPREFLAALGVVSGNADGFTLIEDCTIPFLPLTKQKDCSCCSLVLGPEEVKQRGGLQAVVDSLGHPGLLSLQPGTYTLAAPLRLTKAHDGLTIESCTGGVTITAAGNDAKPFFSGLIELSGVRNVTLRGLEFKPPAGSLTLLKETFATLCCLLIREAEALTIACCTFALNAPSAQTFGYGIAVFGGTRQVTLRCNSFLGSGGGQALIGVIALVFERDAGTELDQWDVSENRFDSLFAGVVGFAQLGLVRCRGNVITGCAAGLVFAEANLGEASSFTHEALNNARDVQSAKLGVAANAVLRPDILTDLAAKGEQILAPTQPATPAPAVSDAAKKVLADQLRSGGVAIYRSLSAGAADTTTAETAVTGAAPAGAATYGTQQVEDFKAPTVNQAVFDQLDAIALSAELDESTLTPAIRFEDNEITITTDFGTPWVGLGLVLSADEPGSVIVSGNRVVVPDTNTVACGLLLPAGAVVTGNLLVQLGKPDYYRGAPCLFLATGSLAVSVASNVIVASAFVIPVAAAPTGVTIWQLLNTIV
jgi:hypothetical protein